MADESGVSRNKVFMPIRLALTGKKISLPIDYTLALLPKDVGHAAAAKGGRLMLLAIVIDLEPNLFKIGPAAHHVARCVFSPRHSRAARLGLWLLEKDKVDVSHGADGVTWMVVLGLVGARVLYVWENFKFFSGQLIHVFYITRAASASGADCFGAILAHTSGARRTKFSFWKVIDAGGRRP